MLHLPKNIVSMKGQFTCSKSVYLGTKCTFIFLVLNHASLHWKHFQTYSSANVRRCLLEITAQNQSCARSSSHNNNNTMLSSLSRNFQTSSLSWTYLLLDTFSGNEKSMVCFLFLRRLGKFAASPCLSIHAADPSWSDIIFSASPNLTTSSPARKLKRHHLLVYLIKKCFSPCFQRTSKEMS